MSAHEQRRLATLHEYRLPAAPGGVRVAAILIDRNRRCRLTTSTPPVTPQPGA